MTSEQKVRGRSIGIVGLARSGMAAIRLASSHGARIFASESAPENKLLKQIEELRSLNIPFEAGGHTERLLTCDYLVISPGVPLDIDIMNKAKEKGIPIFSELEFASWFCDAKIAAITGSNGKTTTATLLGEILSTDGRKVVVCGNVGTPFSEVVGELDSDSIAVVEVSTFQLEAIADFKPDIAAILNLSPDHLDRHKSFENYKRLKLRIAENQSQGDYLILNNEDDELQGMGIESDSGVLHFSTGQGVESATSVRNDRLYVGTDEIIETNKISIKGDHNLQNAAAASLMATLLDVTPKVIATALSAFGGVEHRLEEIGEVAGVSFINDSKATNVDSVCYALRAMERPVYLIAGGRDKGSSYTPITKAGSKRIKGIIAIGEARQKIFDELGKSFPVQFADSLGTAVETAFDQAVPGDCVLLSPGCASFDMFESFEERGKVFKNSVNALKNNASNNETISQ